MAVATGLGEGGEIPKPKSCRPGTRCQGPRDRLSLRASPLGSKSRGLDSPKESLEANAAQAAKVAKRVCRAKTSWSEWSSRSETVQDAMQAREELRA